jgi:hypothetical protein
MPGEVFDDSQRHFLAIPGNATLVLEKLEQDGKAQAG